MEVVLDYKGNVIKVGSRTAPDFYKGEMICPGGVVISVTEAEGDVDNYGRNIQIGPRVYVKYDDGSEDDYLAHYQWNSNEYICDDVEVADERQAD